jgi:hypothetical protein
VNWKNKKLFLSTEQLQEGIKDPSPESTDVIVRFDNGDTYVASFFTYEFVLRKRKEHKRSGKYLNGKYFWSDRMVIIEDCCRKSIKTVVDELKERGDFFTAFRKL